MPSEQSLLKDYDISRLTLREALARLATLGVIEVKHGKGAFVNGSVSITALDKVLIPMLPQLNRDRMHELIEARNLIEAEMAAKVAVRRSEDDIRRLELLLEYDEVQITGPEIFADRDYEFHLAISEMAGNDFFHFMYQTLSSQIHFFLVRYANFITDWQETLNRHRSILEAIIAKDSEGAHQLVRNHARICASFIKEYKTGSTGEPHI
jgi:GntR family transcriptional repressor for pyruvate dehydrogenase complex